MEGIYLNLNFRKERVYRCSSVEHREIMLDIFSRINIKEKEVYFNGGMRQLNFGEFVFSTSDLLDNPYYGFTRSQIRNTLSKLIKNGFLTKIESGKKGSIYCVTQQFVKYFSYER